MNRVCLLLLSANVPCSAKGFISKAKCLCCWLDSSVGTAQHRHRRGHRFESRSSLNFFQLLKLRSNCGRSFFYMIFHPRFKIYVSYIYIYLFILHGYISSSQYDQLRVGLIAHLVEHCTGIAEVIGSNLVQA